MAVNRVVVTLEGKDELSDDLKKLTRAVSALGKDFSKVSATGVKGFGGLQGAIRGSIVQVGLLGAAVTGAMSAASSAIGNAITGYQTLQQTQQSLIADADALNGIINEGFGNTMGILRQERIELEALAIDYGVTGNYAIGVFNNLKDEVAKVAEFTGDSLDEAFAKLQRTAVSLAAVGENEGVTVGQINNLLSKFTTGTLTEGELKELDIANNPKFAAAIEAAKKDLGIEDISELAQKTLEERVKFIEAVGKDLELSKEALEATQKLARTKIREFNAALFGENGLFSFTREIKNLKGNQTLFDAINQIGISLFAEDGLFYAIGNAFTRLTGLDADDLVEGIYKGFVRLDNQLYKLTKFFNGLQKLDFDDALRDIPFKAATFLNNLSSGFRDVDLSGARDMVVDVVNNMLRGIASADFTPFFGNVGALLGEVVNEGALGLASLDWTSVGNILMGALNNTVSAVGNFLASLSPEVYLAGGIALLSAGMVVLIGQVLVALAAPVLVAVGAAVAAAVGGVALVPALLIGGLVLIVTGLVALIAKNWDNIKGWFGELFSNIGKAVSEGWGWLTEKLSDAWDLIKSGFTEAFGVLGDIASWIKNAGGNVWGIITGNSDNPSAAATTSGKGSGAGVTNRAEGFTGDGLIAAAIREQRVAPPNTGLYVGNTSELTLTRQDQAALSRVIADQPKDLPALSIGNVNVYSQASDPKQVAKEVMREIEYRYTAFRSGQLAPSVT